MNKNDNNGTKENRTGKVFVKQGGVTIVNKEQRLLGVGKNLPNIRIKNISKKNRERTELEKNSGNKGQNTSKQIQQSSSSNQNSGKHTQQKTNNNSQAHQGNGNSNNQEQQGNDNSNSQSQQGNGNGNSQSQQGNGNGNSQEQQGNGNGKNQTQQGNGNGNSQEQQGNGNSNSQTKQGNGNGNNQEQQKGDNTSNQTQQENSSSNQEQQSGSQEQSGNTQSCGNGDEQQKGGKFLPISAKEFKKKAENVLGECFDIIIDKFETEREDAVIIYIDGLVDKNLVDRDIIEPLKDTEFDGNVELSIKAAFNVISCIDEASSKVLEGNVVVYYANSTSIYSIDFKKWDKRSVDIPEAEGVTRGPKESFNENLLTNVSLVRRKIQTVNLTVESMILGRQTNTRIAILYLNDIVNKKVLKEVKKRLDRIDVDSILETGQIEQLIEDRPFSIVSGMGLTQKPDVTAAKILEGRVAILCDGTPHCLTIPELFIETIHTSEDYYIRAPYANFIRLLRLMAIILGTLLPGFAVAILTYNQEMVPFIFFESFIQSTVGTPLPEAAELFFLAVAFDLLKEAGLRMPKAIGSAITIVGALVLGDVAVSAGIVGAPSVIIIAITAVASLIVINLNELMTIYRYLFLFLATIVGLIGLAAGFFVVIIQLASTEVFGIPILASFNKEQMKDSFVRSSLRKMKYRPSILAKNNIRRQGASR